MIKYSQYVCCSALAYAQVWHSVRVRKKELLSDTRVRKQCVRYVEKSTADLTGCGHSAT